MKVAIFSAKGYDRHYLGSLLKHDHALEYFEARLDEQTAPLAKGFDCVCVFVHDHVTRAVLETLKAGGTKLVALRCAGFNNVNLKAAAEFGIPVVRVPAYSPYAVAEHAVALMMALNRNLPRAASRTREGNFALDGLLGFDMHGRTVGIVGTGKIGLCVAKILHGFGCRLLGHDSWQNPECLALGMHYVPIAELYRHSDIITLHCPLTKESNHLINEKSVAQMKEGVMLINTGRGALVDASAAIEGIKSGKIGYLGLDVYEEEEGIFFEDHSSRLMLDDQLARLIFFPNVLVTSHMAFFTKDALEMISRVTLDNITQFERTGACVNEVKAQ